MDSTLYNNILYYITHNQFPMDVLGKIEQKQLQKLSKHYFIKNNLLYKNTKIKSLRVIKDSEVESLLFMLHSHPTGGHLGIEKVVEKVREKYYWPQFFEDIKIYISTYDSCQRRGKFLKRG